MKIVKVDFVRFVPSKEILDLLEFDKIVVFSENPNELPDDVIKGYLVKAENARELRAKLNQSEDDWIVGVVGEMKVLKQAVMRKRVDVILDFPGRELDYVTIKLAKEKDVAIEISLSKFLRHEGLKRMKFIEDTSELIKIIKKFDTPFILTSGATNMYEMRTKRQILEFFKVIGADIERAEHWIERLIRRYTDPNYIMDGLEIES
ncbi:MAG TPA: hypothetical protein EYH04_02785 [Archaeoglobus profundus]|nr:hypothetical protein [Archaeoglobus profundus]